MNSGCHFLTSGTLKFSSLMVPNYLISHVEVSHGTGSVLFSIALWYCLESQRKLGQNSPLEVFDKCYAQHQNHRKCLTIYHLTR